MGATGTGKSTFINLISGSTLRIGDGLESCTDTMSATAPFDFQGRKVVLFDTPGFDDTTKSDTDILKMIAIFLTTYHQDGVKLAGVIYMYNINGVRMSGIATRNFRMFRKLCGDESLKNVVIVTNFWSQVDHAQGTARETELCTNDKFFKPVLDMHAKLLRHNGTRVGASTIIEGIMGNHPIALRIQDEILVEQKSLLETAAGTELNHELKEQALKHAKELEEIREEMRTAIEERDEKSRRELETAETKLNEDVRRVRIELQELAATHSEEMKKLEEKLEADNLSNAKRDELQKLIADLLKRNILKRLLNSVPR
ncbi:hypothetical protein FIBSPDRAFT_443279 [Athelia psychrophila]|uniref:G domain-containing protein n=1 Tax=Athelia psychrophila TaxID=1759441 RepID=A0A167UFY6_9AGAM|nr:hypothetical protein FIBSPDRAFT_443279 [Fibularhizoctonia sp. CBS 109695]